jgi:hypothetical protein
MVTRDHRSPVVSCEFAELGPCVRLETGDNPFRLLVCTDNHNPFFVTLDYGNFPWGMLVEKALEQEAVPPGEGAHHHYDTMGYNLSYRYRKEIVGAVTRLTLGLPYVSLPT